MKKVKLINWAEIFEDEWKKRKKSGQDIHYIPLRRSYDIITEFFNNQSKKGWRYVTVIEDDSINYGYSFLFEWDETEYEYNWVLLDEVFKEKINEEVKAGRKMVRQRYEEICDELNITHALYIPTLRYDNDRRVTLPFYLSVEEVEQEVEQEEVDEERKKLYEEYQNDENRNAIWRGKETKGFQEWLENR